MTLFRNSLKTSLTTSFKTAFKQLVTTGFLLGSLVLALPAAAITDMNGQPVNLDNLTGQGKWTVFKIWASDCHVCNHTAHHMNDFDMSADNADIYGISLDGQGGKHNAQRFINKHSVAVPTLLADVMEVDDLIYEEAKQSFIGTPTYMVYDPQGELKAVQAGAITSDQLIGFINKQEATGQ